MAVFAVFLLMLTVASCASIDERLLENEVEVPGVGRIMGTTSQTKWTNRLVYEFRGVPFAEPPEKERRFLYPVKMHSWEPATFMATEFAPACPQPGPEQVPSKAAFALPVDDWVLESRERRRTDPNQKVLGQENNCLTMDIYTPTLNASAKLPVLVYIHGGAFIFGSSPLQRPGYLLERDIVMVVPQYRLGPFGFFYQDDPQAPGNMGLADQAMAMRWVRNNIETFGGDPSQITIGGVSAGAASVSLQMLNKNNTEMGRLFDRVIATSGSALALWALEVDHEQAVTMSSQIAKLAGCPERDFNRMMQCLREANTSRILNAFVVHEGMMAVAGYYGGGASIPVVQTGNEGVHPMVHQLPQCTLEKGSSAHVQPQCYETQDSYLGLPLMQGLTEHEGILVFDLTYLCYMVPNRVINDTLWMRDEFVPQMLKTYGVVENSRVMADACTRRYFNHDDLGDFDAMVPGMIDFFSAIYFKGPVFRQTELHSLKEKVYLYSFEYHGEHSMRTNNNLTVDLPGGITHADDTLYLFPLERYPMTRPLDIEVSKKLVDLYANFITWGDPTPNHVDHSGIPTWLAYTREESNYLKIEDTMELHSNYRDTLTTARKNGLDTPVYPYSHATLPTINAVLFIAAIYLAWRP